MEIGPERLREERPQPLRERAEPDHARAEGEPVPHGAAGLNPRAALLLQGRAGNRAVSRLVAQRTAAKAKAKAAPKPAAAPAPASVPAVASAAPTQSPQGTVDAAPEVAPVQRLADGRPYASPKQDPKFNALTRDVKTKKNLLAKHPPAKSEADNAAKAAKPPQDDKEAQGKAANTEKMNNAKPGGFDKAAFIKAVNDAIAKKAPQNLDEADKFGNSGKAEDVKREVNGKVDDGKKNSANAIETTTKAPPDTSAAKEKAVTPLTPDKPPGTPAAPDPASAVPDKAPPAATDFSEGPKSVKDEMAGAEVTEEQLAKSNEPEFNAALKDKKAGEDHAATAPGVVRGKENEVLTKAKADAKQTGTTALNAMSATRNKTGKDLDSGKNKAQSTDEQKRAQVNAKLQTVFDATKKDVEGILTGLDKKVDDKFTADEKTARDNFTADHKRRMDAYKDKRYSGWTGGLKWAKDKLMGMPEEANQIFVAARQTYVNAMQGVISGVADLIAKELNAAKDRIAKGRTDLKAAVDSLSPELKRIGQQAAGDFAGKFDELNENVDNKGNELVDTLATKYSDALKAVDDEIAEEKEKNKGLVAKAIDAVKGVIQTILELKNLLLNVLAKAVSAIGAIIKDPIGFLGNLISAVGGGLKSFMANIGTHLKKGLVSWLLGAAAKAGLELPEKFDLKGILGMLASLLGLTWGAIKGRIISKGVPPEAMAAAETSVPMVQKLAGGGGLKGLWEDIKEKIGDLKETLLSKISEFLIPTVLMAGITWIISLLNPASAFVKACKAIIDIVTFIVQRGAQIAEFVNAILDSVIAIAKGGSGGVGALIENALAKSIPVLIGFLAALLGVGGIAEKVKKIFQAMSKPVMKVVDWVVGKIVGIAKKIWAKMKGLGKKIKDKFTKKKDGKDPAKTGAVDLPLPTKPFATKDGEQHKVLFTGKGASAELKVHSVEQRISDFLAAWATEVKNTPAGPDREREAAAQDAAAKKAAEVDAAKTKLGRDATTDPNRQNDYDKLVADMTVLAGLLAARSAKPPLPPPVVPPFSNGVLAKGFKAEYLPKDINTIHPGENSKLNNGATLKGWSVVAPLNIGTNQSLWVKMHQLPEIIGGKATDSNLVPALGTTNSSFRTIERAAADALAGPADMIWYQVQVSTYGGAEEGVLQDITVSWGQYVLKNGKWEAGPAVQTKPSGTQPLPGVPNPLLLSTLQGRRWVSVANAIWGTQAEPGFCQTVINEIKDGGAFASVPQLVARMTARLPGPASAAKIQALVDAINAGRINL